MSMLTEEDLIREYDDEDELPFTDNLDDIDDEIANDAWELLWEELG